MIPTRVRRTALAVFLGVVSSLSPLQARFDPEIDAAARRYVDDHVRHWLTERIIIESVLAQNLRHADLDQQRVDALDKLWSKQSARGGPLIDEVLGNSLSMHLRRIERRTNGLVTEILVMDKLGLNVGLSNLTSDYWQGDEDKWRKTFLVGPEAIFIDEVDLDESSQRYQTQVSLPVVDPATGNVIGAVTVGIDAEGLLLLQGS
ncbi:hypothetical protein ACUNV4_00835 [Granulosicoccus sp. 3-233]|uniref:hypothetical protein n=1 Tax=Granulosicoccus sp. 3-233 TaxID=3417969 RepID=UPI003D344D8F